MVTFNSFFLIVNPGLEDLAQMELDEKTSIYGVEIISRKITHGGIEVQAEFDSGVLLNHILKIPTRILLRIHRSKVRDFPRLYKKIKNLPLSLFLNGGLPVIKSSATESRLIHSDRMSDTAKDAINRFYVQNAIKKKFLENKESDKNKTLYLRLKNDELDISIDTSGEALYKRNQRSYRAPGCLRETFSAALFYDFKNQVKEDIQTLFDPFAGSGTILIEAKKFYQKNSRDFIYQDFPCYEKKQVLKEIQLDEIKVSGNEIDIEVYEKSVADLRGVHVQNKDSLNESTPHPFIICNPPYGKQVKGLPCSVNEIAQKLLKNFQFKYLGILHPDKVKANSDFKVLSLRKFSNNSIDVFFTIVKAN